MRLLNSSDLHKIFEDLDKNKDGFVSIEEITSFLGQLDVCISVHELESIAGRKSFDLEEFTLFCEATYKQDVGGRQLREEEYVGDEESDLVEAFKVFDLNDDGFISSDELQCVLSRLGLWEEKSGCDGTKMISEFDKNSDGMLDFDEFKSMLMT